MGALCLLTRRVALFTPCTRLVLRGQQCGSTLTILFDLPPPDATEGASGAADELATIMATIREDPGFAALARDEVETVLQDLPVALRDRLMADEAARDAMVDKLTKAGAELVLAQMKGAGH